MHNTLHTVRGGEGRRINLIKIKTPNQTRPVSSCLQQYTVNLGDSQEQSHFEAGVETKPRGPTPDHRLHLTVLHRLREYPPGVRYLTMRPASFQAQVLFPLSF